MRLLVRPGVRIKSQARIFKGRRQRTEQTESPSAFPAGSPSLRVNRFQGGGGC